MSVAMWSRISPIMFLPLLIYLPLEVILKVVEVLLEVRETEIVLPMVVVAGLLSLLTDMDSAILYLEELI